MKVIDPGHIYTLDSLDGDQENRIVFVKREGDKYPGNVGHHPGTTMQEVLRALIHRAEYVNRQIPCLETESAIYHMTRALYLFEIRAADRHGRLGAFDKYLLGDIVSGKDKCSKCGHVGCSGDCH